MRLRKELTFSFADLGRTGQNEFLAKLREARKSDLETGSWKKKKRVESDSLSDALDDEEEKICKPKKRKGQPKKPKEKTSSRKKTAAKSKDISQMSLEEIQAALEKLKEIKGTEK